jgi:hypothetical protein
MPKEPAIDLGPAKRQPRKGKPRQPELAHEIEALVGKSSEQEQRKINGDRSPSLPSRERLAQVLRWPGFSEPGAAEDVEPTLRTRRTS